MTRPRGPAAWIPQRATQALLEQVRSVLTEYAAHLPLTVRQIFYRLVGAYAYGKTEKAYKRLGECLNRARRSSLIAWESIRDDGFDLHEPLCWDDPEEVAGNFLYNLRRFKLDRQCGQPTRLLIAIEAAGMLPQIERLSDPFGIPCYAAGGFDSSTAKHELAETVARWGNAEVLHIGDHDPSGVHLFSSMAEDVAAFVAAFDPDARVTFSRLAVTPEQIVALNLPTAPAKETDRRSFTGQTVQAEAIPPDVLAEIVRRAIETRIDRRIYDSVLADEAAVRQMGVTEIVNLVRLAVENEAT